MIAAASVAAALHGLGWTNKTGGTLPQLLQRLHQITAIEQVRSVNIYLRILSYYLLQNQTYKMCLNKNFCKKSH